MDTEDSQAWRSLETVETSSQVARLADAWWRTGESGPHRDSSAVGFGSLPMILMLDHVGTFKVVLKTPSSGGLSGDCPPSHGGSQLMWDCFSVVVWCCWSSRCHLTSLLSCCLASEWNVLLLLSQSVLRTHGPATNSLVLHKQTAVLSSKGDNQLQWQLPVDDPGAQKTSWNLWMWIPPEIWRHRSSTFLNHPYIPHLTLWRHPLGAHWQLLTSLTTHRCLAQTPWRTHGFVHKQITRLGKCPISEIHIF